MIIIPSKPSIDSMVWVCLFCMRVWVVYHVNCDWHEIHLLSISHPNDLVLIILIQWHSTWCVLTAVMTWAQLSCDSISIPAHWPLAETQLRTDWAGHCSQTAPFWAGLWTLWTSPWWPCPVIWTPVDTWLISPGDTNIGQILTSTTGSPVSQIFLAFSLFKELALLETLVQRIYLNNIPNGYL